MTIPIIQRGFEPGAAIYFPDDIEKIIKPSLGYQITLTFWIILSSVLMGEDAFLFFFVFFFEDAFLSTGVH